MSAPKQGAGGMALASRSSSPRGRRRQRGGPERWSITDRRQSTPGSRGRQQSLGPAGNGRDRGRFDQRRAVPGDRRRGARQVGSPRHADGPGAADVPPVHAPPPARPGRPGLGGPRPLRAVVRPRLADCCMPRCICPATTSRSTTSSSSASGARARPVIPSAARRRASRSPPVRSARASPTRSAWRSPSACWRPASTGPISSWSIIAPGW